MTSPKPYDKYFCNIFELLEITRRVGCQILEKCGDTSETSRAGERFLE